LSGNPINKAVEGRTVYLGICDCQTDCRKLRKAEFYVLCAVLIAVLFYSGNNNVVIVAIEILRFNNIIECDTVLHNFKSEK